MASVRLWVKRHLPFPAVTGIAHLVNRPWMEDLHRTERIVEYAWVLAQIGKRHPAGGRILDFGYAGSYFAEMLCQFGEVVGVDPRKTPEIRHPSFSHCGSWRHPLCGRDWDTIVCVSVLEHLPPRERTFYVAEFVRHLTPGGQALVTVPWGAEGQFRGYQAILDQEIRGWPGYASQEVFVRSRGCWGPKSAMSAWPANTEYEVNAVACTRLSRVAGI